MPGFSNRVEEHLGVEGRPVMPGTDEEMVRAARVVALKAPRHECREFLRMLGLVDDLRRIRGMA